MSTYRLQNINHRPPTPVDAGIYADIRFDESDDEPTYIGLHVTSGASTAEESWKIYKFTYDSDGGVTRIQLAYGAWDSRVSLF